MCSLVQGSAGMRAKGGERQCGHAKQHCGVCALSVVTRSVLHNCSSALGMVTRSVLRIRRCELCDSKAGAMKQRLQVAIQKCIRHVT